MTLDDSFPRTYEASIHGPFETPDGLEFIPARPSLIVEIRPKREPAWTAVFGGEGSFVTGLYTTPNEEVLCVVSNGSGYHVLAESSQEWLPVECMPIRYVIPMPQHDLIVFADWISLVAYGPHPDSGLEVAWRSERLGYDDLEITGVTAERIEGRAWNAPDDTMYGFSVDGRSGRHEGGAYDMDG